ncbi:LysR family transcriptional regulator [Rhizobium mesosinicum]|uniref:LysR family transcriptional regulator n=1 Tax=Rhizobium mesosinicum TaxID=335017 RepID=A0ABS7GM05_9HYPH|nr:LysR family transcriptional regulator [Rhizobium mesosinicum]MBW9051023.1 LysR family transcriptional regulator [Rhizobium mesosinicum]
MDFDQLRAFVVIAEEGHLGRASDKLNLTQSAVSKRLKSLEDIAGRPLFLRSREGMTITAFGTALLPHARHALEAMRKVRDLVVPAKSVVRGIVDIGTIIDPESLRLGPLLRLMAELHPELTVRVVHGTTGDGIKGVSSKRLDAAFCLGEIDDAHLATIPLSTERYAVAIPTRWLGKLPHNTAEEIAALPWVGVSEGSSQIALFKRLFGPTGMPIFAAEADQESSIISLARAEVGACLIRRNLLSDPTFAQGLSILPQFELFAPLNIIVRAGDRKRAEIVALAASLSRIWKAEAEL